MQQMVVVIFGATGDLTQRKLIPALHKLYERKNLPESFLVVGFGRKQLTQEQFRALHTGDSAFLEHVNYVQGAYDSPEGYKRLAELVQKDANILFYLSTPPEVYGAIVSNLKQAGLSEETAGWRRVIIEKPFGSDTASARKLNATLREVFREDQVFRIDHYLAKPAIQHLLAFRKEHEHKWNKDHIDHVQITVSEDAGVASRVGYYDTTGALRDMVQSHILQVLALVAMDHPPEAAQTRAEKLKVLSNLHFPEGHEKNVVRGRYSAGSIAAKEVQAYTQEAGVRGDSKTETFVAMKLGIQHPRWTGVPFYLRTGKRLPSRFAEVTVVFKDKSTEPVTIKINPRSEQVAQEAHEILFPHVLEGNTTLFPSWEEIEHAWSLVDGVIAHWDTQSAHPEYPAGSWGPKEADELVQRDNRSWIN